MPLIRYSLLGLFFLIELISAATLDISTDGRYITIDDQPVFLRGISYYGALTIDDPAYLTADLNDMVAAGFNWIRVWAFWEYNGIDVSALDAGTATTRAPYLDRLKTLISECNSRGIIVDVTFSRYSRPFPSTHAEHLACVQKLAQELSTYDNIYFDVGNERNIQDIRYVPMNEVGELVDAIKAIDPDRLCTASGVPYSASELNDYFVTGHCDFITPHLCRDAGCAAQTLGQVKEYLSWMQQYGFCAPIHLQEPFRLGYNTQYEPVTEDFLRDCSGAKNSGAAGWCLHNGAQFGNRPFRSFDMRTTEGRLFSQLTTPETNAVDQLASTIGGNTTSLFRYQAEFTEQLPHLIGRKDGSAWSANVAQGAPGFLSYGPYIDTVPAGSHTVTWRTQIDNNSADNEIVLTIDVFSQGTQIAGRNISRQDFIGTGQYQNFELEFTSTG